MNLKIKIANRDIPIEWENQTAVKAIMNKLSSVKKLSLSKNGVMQSGGLGISVPRNDRSLITKAGDIAVQGDKLVIFSGEDDVSCTKLGHINGLSESQIKNLLNPGSIAVELYEG